MKRIGKVVAINREICTIEFETKVGCCGGRRRIDGTPACADSLRILSFKAHRGQHKEVKIGDRVVAESDSYMVWWQALVGLVLPCAVALYLYFGLHYPWFFVILPFLVAWGILLLSRLMCVKATIPTITIVNPPYLIQDAQ